MATHSSILAGEFQGEKCLVDYSPQDYKESDTTEATQRACTHTHTHTHTGTHTHTHTCMETHIPPRCTPGDEPSRPQTRDSIGSCFLASSPAWTQRNQSLGRFQAVSLFWVETLLGCLIQPQYGAEVKSKNSAKRCEAHYLTSLCLNFPICKMGTMLVSHGVIMS